MDHAAVARGNLIITKLLGSFKQAHADYRAAHCLLNGDDNTQPNSNPVFLAAIPTDLVKASDLFSLERITAILEVRGGPNGFDESFIYRPANSNPQSYGQDAKSCTC